MRESTGISTHYSDQCIQGDRAAAAVVLLEPLHTFGAKTSPGPFSPGGYHKPTFAAVHGVHKSGLVPLRCFEVARPLGFPKRLLGGQNRGIRSFRNHTKCAMFAGLLLKVQYWPRSVTEHPQNLAVTRSRS